jgi:DNA-binding MarR family transcriptional regulator
VKKVKIKKDKPKKKSLRPETIAAADRLHSAAIHLLRRVRRQDAASGVGPAQLSALSVLVFSGTKPSGTKPLGTKTLGELAAAEQVKPPTMSRIVAGLKRSRLVEITRDPRDARRMNIRPTAKGTRLLQQGRRRRIEYLAAHLASLARRELHQLDRAAGILETLLRNWR